jgi:hypothetical protein
MVGVAVAMTIAALSVVAVVFILILAADDAGAFRQMVMAAICTNLQLRMISGEAVLGSRLAVVWKCIVFKNSFGGARVADLGGARPVIHKDSVWIDNRADEWQGIRCGGICSSSLLRF